ncbi:hypothetical protein [Cryptosporangium sp. NPDC051539]|uniref:hypothetical protein n=1 Tax=Cryptosporangium sp. NPDC051539 TaxID=3363962 RepID=UPI0037A45F19
MTATIPCPVGDACEACGTDAYLVACEADTSLGVLCATVCEHCHLPSIGLGHAMGRILAHCEHMGTRPEGWDE